VDEIAELVDSSVGDVKAPVNRARTKLAESAPPGKPARSASPELKQIMQLYVDPFNRRDWDGVRELTTSVAQRRAAERFGGKLVEAPYFTN
jgi:RNA polymerase sigma-70 factor (ECF subfamily)